MMKTKVDYIEMSIADFVTHFTQEWAMLCERFPQFKKIDITDDEYTVRFTANGDLEIGYRSDVWTIGS